MNSPWHGQKNNRKCLSSEHVLRVRQCSKGLDMGSTSNKKTIWNWHLLGKSIFSNEVSLNVAALLQDRSHAQK